MIDIVRKETPPEKFPMPDAYDQMDERRAQAMFEAVIKSSGRTLVWAEASPTQRRDAFAAARAIRWSDHAAGTFCPWEPIETYPMTGPVLRVRVKMADGTVHKDAHWACGDGDGFMPPFRGWFIPSGIDGFTGIDTPIEWVHPNSEVYLSAPQGLS